MTPFERSRSMPADSTVRSAVCWRARTRPAPPGRIRSGAAATDPAMTRSTRWPSQSPRTGSTAPSTMQMNSPSAASTAAWMAGWRSRSTGGATDRTTNEAAAASSARAGSGSAMTITSIGWYVVRSSAASRRASTSGRGSTSTIETSGPERTSDSGTRLRTLRRNSRTSQGIARRRCLIRRARVRRRARRMRFMGSGASVVVSARRIGVTGRWDRRRDGGHPACAGRHRRKDSGPREALLPPVLASLRGCPVSRT